MIKNRFMKNTAIVISALLAMLQLDYAAPISKTVNAATIDYTWNNNIPEKSPASGTGNGKLILFDNSHGETAGQADWVIDGGFSDFADDLVTHGYTVREYRGVDKNGDGCIRFYDDRKSENVDKNEAVITYDSIKDADVFVMAEANRPFTIAEQDALKKFVDSGKGIYFIADHYNADRNMNTWDATETYNGYNRSTSASYNMGGAYGDLRNPQNASKGWLAENFGLRFRFNAIDLISGLTGVKPVNETEGLTKGVSNVLMAAGSTLAIVDGSKAKGLVYFGQNDKPAKWGSAADTGLYYGGEAEGAYVAISKPSKGKAAFIGDSSPIEDITCKYKNEGSGKVKSTHNGYKDAGNAAVLSVNIVNWLSTPEEYVGFDGVNHTKGINTPTPLAAIEKDQSQAEPWATPTYDPWNTDTFATGAYNAPQGPAPTVVNVTGVSLDETAVTLNPGTTQLLTATVAPSNATNKNITWTSTDTNVATVLNGTVTAKAEGTSVITVSTVDGAQIATCTITVTNTPIPIINVTGVSLDKSSLALATGSSAKLTQTIAPGNATNKNVTWLSSNVAVASVINGIVTANAEGTAVITVTTVDGEKTATSNVTVTTPQITNFINEGFGTVLGSSSSITSGIPADWIFTSGMAIYNTTGNYGASSPSIKLQATGNQITTPIFNLTAEGTLSFWIKGNGTDGTSHLFVEKFDGTSWTVVEDIKPLLTSAATKTYTVAQNIKQVRFTYTKGAGNLALDDVKVTQNSTPVNVSVTGINLNKSQLNLNKGQASNLIASVAPSNATNKNIVWSSSDSKVATVDGSGRVIANELGSAVITATTVDGGFKAVCSINVCVPNSAEIISSNIPTTMEAGKTYTANIVVKNTGSNTWTLKDNYRLGAVNDSDPFAVTRICMEDNEGVAPGQTKSFAITMTAPKEAGTYNSDWQMVQELVEWFGAATATTITVTPSVLPNNAEIISNTIPVVMEAGKTYTANIVVKNTGSNTWTPTGNYRLGAVGDSDPFATARVYMEGNESIAPGDTKTFSIIMTAPNTAGIYTTDWQMVQELVEWFGASISTTVTVMPAVLPNNAEIISSDIPTTMEVGKIYTATIVVKNTGSNTWIFAENYRLGAVEDSDPFAVTRISMENSETVAPGQTKTFTITMTAPNIAGIYTTDWQMVQELVEWFGAKFVTTITVKNIQ